MMPRPSKKKPIHHPEPTEAEWPLLNWLWSNGPATVREIWQAMGSKGSYTTVLKQCQVMFEKGLVFRDDSQRTHVYRAALPQQKVQKSLLGKMVQQVFEGSAVQLVLGALSSTKISVNEREDIRKLLDEMEQKESASKGANR